MCGEVCPPRSFCQHCASPGVKANVVGPILAQTYAEINLDETPCIFPQCGHFLTVKSMDEQMDMNEYYKMEDSKPVAIRSSLEPFSVDDITRRATCHGSLRDLSRYGRIVRRVVLDKLTKRSHLCVYRSYVSIAQTVEDVMSELDKSKGKPAPLLLDSQETITIQGSRDNQFTQMCYIMKKYGGDRWKGVSQLRDLILNFQKTAGDTVRSFARVQTLVESARKRKGTACAVVVQTKGVFLATSLLMRLNISLLGEFLTLHKQIQGRRKCKLTVDFSAILQNCRDFVNRARVEKWVAHEVEGYIFLARLHALVRNHSSTVVLDPYDSEKHALKPIKSARRLCKQHPDETCGLGFELTTLCSCSGHGNSSTWSPACYA